MLHTSVFLHQLTEKQNKAGQRRLIDWMNDYPIIDYMNVDEVIILIEMTNFRLRGTLYFDLIADKNLVQTSKNIHRRTNILFSFGNISCSCMLGHDSNVQIQTILHRLLCFFILYINVNLIPPSYGHFCDGVQLYWTKTFIKQSILIIQRMKFMRHLSLCCKQL